MLINGSKLINCPVLSLHVGGRIARVTSVIIDPNNLKIIAFRVDGPQVGREAGEILPTASIREFSRLGMIVDSVDEFVAVDDIVHIKEIIGLNFDLVGLKVETKKGSKLGKVLDYTVEPSAWQVQQLIVQRPFMKAFLDPELTISYKQIDEVTDYKVIVKNEEDKIKSRAKTDFVPSFVNPFREPDFASDLQAKKDQE